jgi:ATP-dependent protease ClpP protease subunit
MTIMTKLLTFIAAVTLIALLPLKASATVVQLPSLHIMLTTQKVVHIGDVEKAGLERFRREYKEADKLPGDMIVLINSNGGYQEMGQEMINAIKFQQKKGVKVICIVEDHAASMAFNILTNCSVRAATRNARLMFHKLSLVSWPKGKRLTARNLRIAADDLDKDDEPYRQANAKALSLTLEEYDAFADRDAEWKAPELLIIEYLHAVTE